MARILVIDDDPLTREYVAKIVASAGHSVEQAEDGVQGLEVFRKRPAELVITDMVMPRADGVQVIETLLRDHPNLPVVAMSGAPESAQFLYLASYLGAGKVLTKPVTAEAMLGAVNSALSVSPKK
ncbi:MAG: response regulator [Verrucomicrobia bacterium]|nr:response regulator [Verrucomicrobiota bacterium]